MRWVLSCLLFCCLAAPAAADMRRPMTGPVEARVVRVIDGDTFVADARIWPGQTIRVSIRIRGIDAPELRTRCERERQAGEAARDRLAALLGFEPVAILNIGADKYYGRVLADVEAADGAVAAMLLGEGLVQPYEGGRRMRMCAGNGEQARMR